MHTGPDRHYKSIKNRENRTIYHLAAVLCFVFSEVEISIDYRSGSLADSILSMGVHLRQGKSHSGVQGQSSGIGFGKKSPKAFWETFCPKPLPRLADIL